MNNFIKYLQSRSYQTKGQITALVITIVAIGLGAVWINTIRTDLGGLEKVDLLPSSGEVLSAVNHVTVESLESKNGKKYLYFKVENNTSDILNFPTTENISLKVKGAEIRPNNIIDRQEQQFVTRVLSKTTNYGVMIFPDFNSDDGTLTISQMSFEKKPGNIFKQSIELDFEKLKPFEELRS